MNKPEALRLADLLAWGTATAFHHAQAAAELRRLHQFAEEQIGRATAAEAALQMTKATNSLKIAAVERQRDALLEALKYHQEQTRPIQRSIDAIDAVEGEKG